MIYALQSSLYAVLVLVVVLISLKKHQDLKSMNNVYYVTLIYLVISVLLVDMISVLFDGMTFPYIQILLNFTSFLLYSFGVLIAFTWVLFVRHHIFKNKYLVKKHLWFLVIPVIINTLVSFISMFSNIFFIINENNMYERGTYYLINFMINYSLLIYSIYLIIRHHKLLIRKDILALLMFPLLPFLGSLIQILVFGTLLIWPMAALSLLIIFIFIQSRLVNIDPLTELFNKRELSNFIMSFDKRYSQESLVGGIFFDIDNFKLINDTYGHAKGDDVLIAFASLLRNTLRRDDFVARIGGDEFAAFVNIKNPADLDDIINRLRKSFDDFNTLQIIDKKITISTGYAIYDRFVHKNFENFADILDQRMYNRKTEQKNTKK